MVTSVSIRTLVRLFFLLLLNTADFVFCDRFWLRAKVAAVLISVAPLRDPSFCVERFQIFHITIPRRQNCRNFLYRMQKRCLIHVLYYIIDRALGPLGVFFRSSPPSRVGLSNQRLWFEQSTTSPLRIESHCRKYKYSGPINGGGKGQEFNNHDETTRIAIKSPTRGRHIIESTLNVVKQMLCPQASIVHAVACEPCSAGER